MPRKNSICKICRREGKKLFLKGTRCIGVKCSFTKRPYPPGKSSQIKSVKNSEYSNQLREKQKAKSIYNLNETQFKNYYLKASKTKEASGVKLLQMLETRLDNVVYKLGFAHSIRNARQLVSHKKIMVNGKVVNIPSYILKEKDKIEPVNKEKIDLVKTEIPIWLKLDKQKLSGEIIKMPERNEITTDINEDLIVEFYSR